MNKIIEMMSLNFTCCLEKMFILNPSFTLMQLWRAAKSNKTKILIIFKEYFVKNKNRIK